MTGRLNIFATVLSEHRLHVARCTCLAWDADLTLDARSVRIEEQHRLHVAAALDAALGEREGDRLAAVDAALGAVEDQDGLECVWAALGDPAVPLAKVKADALREAAREVYGDERAAGEHWHPLSIASWLRERASRIEAEAATP